MYLTFNETNENLAHDQMLMHLRTDEPGGFVRVHKIATLDGMKLKLLISGGKDGKGDCYITVNNGSKKEIAALTTLLKAIHEAYEDTRPDPAGQSST